MVHDLSNMNYCTRSKDRFLSFSSGAGVPGIFYSTVGNISDKYQLYITPAGFTFSIWGLIFFWLAASMLFLIATIFLKTSDGK